jgi:hypothetical protein
MALIGVSNPRLAVRGPFHETQPLLSSGSSLRLRNPAISRSASRSAAGLGKDSVTALSDYIHYIHNSFRVMQQWLTIFAYFWG